MFNPSQGDVALGAWSPGGGAPPTASRAEQLQGPAPSRASGARRADVPVDVGGLGVEAEHSSLDGDNASPALAASTLRTASHEGRDWLRAPPAREDRLSAGSGPTLVGVGRGASEATGELDRGASCPLPGHHGDTTSAAVGGQDAARGVTNWLPLQAYQPAEGAISGRGAAIASAESLANVEENEHAKLHSTGRPFYTAVGGGGGEGEGKTAAARDGHEILRKQTYTSSSSSSSGVVESVVQPHEGEVRHGLPTKSGLELTTSILL